MSGWVAARDSNTASIVYPIYFEIKREDRFTSRYLIKKLSDGCSAPSLDKFVKEQNQLQSMAVFANVLILFVFDLTRV